MTAHPVYPSIESRCIKKRDGGQYKIRPFGFYRRVFLPIARSRRCLCRLVECAYAWLYRKWYKYERNFEAGIQSLRMKNTWRLGTHESQNRMAAQRWFLPLIGAMIQTVLGLIIFWNPFSTALAFMRYIGVSLLLEGVSQIIFSVLTSSSRKDYISYKGGNGKTSN